MMVEEDKDKSPHVNTDETDEEAQDTCLIFDDDLDSEVNDFTIEEDDHIFMVMAHLVNPHHFVCASSMVSRHLAEAFAKTQSQRVSRILCRHPYTHMPMSLVKQPSTHSQSAANGTLPLSWSTSSHLYSAKSIR
jgi:hypothetical protein